MTRRTDTVPAEPPDFLTVDEIAAILRISLGRAYQLVRRGVATNGREGIPAERVDKQFRISRYVIEEQLGGPITWPIPGFHACADVPTANSAEATAPTQPAPNSDVPAPKPTRRTRSNPPDAPPDTQLRLFPL